MEDNMVMKMNTFHVPNLHYKVEELGQGWGVAWSDRDDAWVACRLLEGGWRAFYTLYSPTRIGRQAAIQRALREVRNGDRTWWTHTKGECK